MALVLKRLYEGYFWLFDEVSDPRANDYYLMSSPFPTIILLAIWLKFIFNWGPKYMEKRKPYELKNVLIVYNLIQILSNLYLVYEGSKEFKNINWECTPVDYSERGRHLLTLTYAYFMIKISDLLDTVFFVLRKRQRQVSFLHVYHHFGMVAMTWVGAKFIGGGHSFYVGFVNSIVHIIMYSYYLLAAFDSSYKTVLWIKKFITQVQLAQFIFLMYVYGKLLFNNECTYPKICSYFFVPQNFFMISLFTDFYIRTYVLPSKKKEDTLQKQTKDL